MGRGRGIITVVLDFACGREKRKNIRQRDDVARRDQPVDSLCEETILSTDTYILER